MNVELARELFQSLPDFASLTELVLPAIPETNDWDIVAEALTANKGLKRVTFTLFGEGDDVWARVLDAGLRAATPLSSVELRIFCRMGETALQALENLFLNKSLSSVSVIVEGDMSHSLAVSLSRALAGEGAVKSLELRVNGKLSFCCAYLIEQGIVKNNSLSNLVFSLHGERPDNWQAIVENLNAQLAEKSSVTFEIQPNTFSPVTATQLTDVGPCVMKYRLFEQESVTLNVWARHVDKQKSFFPITINTWNQLTNEGKALFKELELDKNPAVTLNVCEVDLSSDESDDNKIESIDDPESLIALFEEAENTGKENLTVTINIQSDDSTYDYVDDSTYDDSDDSTCDDSDDSTCDDSDNSTGRSWIDILPLGWARSCSLNSLSLTINNFRPWSTKLSITLIDCLEGCSSLKSLTLTLNEYNGWESTYAFRLREGLRRSTSLISLTLTFNIHCITLGKDDDFDISKHFYDPNMSVDSFTLTISDFTGSGGEGLDLDVLLSAFKSLTTLNVTLNRCRREVYSLYLSLVVDMETDSLRTLRLKFNDSRTSDHDFFNCNFSEWVLNSPSLELIELSISRYGVVGSSLQTLKWEKQ
ncbi:PREDICTED: uncharacterized protein LOC107355855 [Acropora digitifera]|uniref:uncharacterized protein LOC107355855 n=1 Tax=Acropora digitifera TaxID=70779 RepID=UPI00077AFB56|nr:PREDICTED: uncharacterized protein LOC107355855 [Acropora digitifera]